jgi:hypothetical protein
VLSLLQALFFAVSNAGAFLSLVLGTFVLWKRLPACTLPLVDTLAWFLPSPFRSGDRK